VINRTRESLRRLCAMSPATIDRRLAADRAQLQVKGTARNTWLFAAGRLFAGGDFHRKLVLDIIGHCDQRGHWPGWLYQAAPELCRGRFGAGLTSEIARRGG
jgi:hypothetical protein